MPPAIAERRPPQPASGAWARQSTAPVAIARAAPGAEVRSSTVPHGIPYGATTMNSVHSSSWTTFAYASFGSASTMTALGIWALPADFWVKGYLAMAMVFLVGACFTLAKTLRDDHEAKRLANRIEDAKTEKLLMEMNGR